MKRAIVCVATTERYRRGMVRLFGKLPFYTNPHYRPYTYGDLREGWPSHEDKPYAFKAFAMKQAADDGCELLLWCDACMLPVRSMEPLWEKIERDGYWICRNGWSNYEWTADSAYRDLFTPELATAFGLDSYIQTGILPTQALHEMRNINRLIPHVVATSFGLNVKSDIGRAFLDEYFRLASETRAFCGSWANTNYGNANPVVCSPLPWSVPQPCGPPDVRGHRHDQTAASVIAWRLGMKLTDPPEIFAYGTTGGQHDPKTILIADGSYE